MTSFGCRDQCRDSVCPVLWMSTWRNSKKRGKWRESLVRIPTRVCAAADRPPSYGNQTISSTRPRCWIQISTVDVINTDADHHMFMTLTGELSWQRLRRSAVDFYSKKRKITLWATLSGLRGNVRTPSIGLAHWKVRGRLYIRRNWTFFRYRDFLTMRYINPHLIDWLIDCDVMSGNRSKSSFFEGVGHFRRIFDWDRGIAHQPLLVPDN